MALGTLKLPTHFGKHFLVIGGPFVHANRNTFNVKMAAEINHRYDVSIPTQDYNVPPLNFLNIGLEATVDVILQGRPVYVGCMAGKGRTGLFLAILAKAFGIPNPVEYVRENYYAHAVETDRQYKFVMAYEVSPAVLNRIRKAKLKSVFTLRKCQTKS